MGDRWRARLLLSHRILLIEPDRLTGQSFQNFLIFSGGF
jgi:hypothetical protein